VKAAVRFDHQAQFHPRKYLLSLAKEIPGAGCHIFEMTRAVDIQEGAPYKIITDKDIKITAPRVVIASHYPFCNLRGLYAARIYVERSYILAAKVKEEFPQGMFINAENPTRSLRSQKYKNDRLVLFAGEHHKTGQGANTIHHYKNLKDFAQQNYTVEDIPYRWSAQDCMTLDDIPYVGLYTLDTPDLYVATGFGKWGMTNSTVSAMMIKDMIVKGSSPWEPVYSPSRFTPVASAKNFIVENANVAKELIEGKLITVPDELDIQNGEAKVIGIEGKKVGAYRDEEGKLHLVDTTCTHLGCELHWNAAERSWDCPCHGSRFTYDGQIAEGPALHPLKKL
jgi:Rieske Fe-S protein